MKIAKEFHWEMGHRLPEHFGKCKNVHGHSYKMTVEIEGDVMESGMVMDYYELSKIVKPIVEEMDHSFMVYKEDTDIIQLLNKLNSKKIIADCHSTVENICIYVMEKIKQSGFPANVKKLRLRIQETYNDYAELETVL
jgi:6-pyruvoyltetrahydropterin/6-carboxytetrahydropterin synthase